MDLEIFRQKKEELERIRMWKGYPRYFMELLEDNLKKMADINPQERVSGVKSTQRYLQSINLLYRLLIRNTVLSPIESPEKDPDSWIFLKEMNGYRSKRLENFFCIYPPEGIESDPVLINLDRFVFRQNDDGRLENPFEIPFLVHGIISNFEPLTFPYMPEVENKPTIFIDSFTYESEFYILVCGISFCNGEGRKIGQAFKVDAEGELEGVDVGFFGISKIQYQKELENRRCQEQNEDEKKEN